MHLFVLSRLFSFYTIISICNVTIISHLSHRLTNYFSRSYLNPQVKRNELLVNGSHGVRKLSSLSYKQIKTFGLCVGVQGNSGIDKKKNGAMIQLEACNDSWGSQQWAQDRLGRLVNLYTGKCLEAGDKETLYAKAFIWDCHSGTHQQWQALDNGRYQNKKYPERYIGVAYCGKRNDFRVLELRSLELGTDQCGCAQTWNKKGCDFWTYIIGPDSDGTISNYTAFEDGSNAAFTGKGKDIWTDQDSFTFSGVSIPNSVTSSHFAVTIRTENGFGSSSNDKPWAKFGLMVRDTMSSTSKHFSVLLTQSEGVHAIYRKQDSGSSVKIPGDDSVRGGGYLNIQRSGDTFRAYFMKLDGTNFQEIGSTKIEMNGPVEVGVALASHDRNRYFTVQFSDFGIQVRYHMIQYRSPSISTSFVPSVCFRHHLTRACRKYHICNSMGYHRKCTRLAHSQTWNASSPMGNTNICHLLIVIGKTTLSDSNITKFLEALSSLELLICALNGIRILQQPSNLRRATRRTPIRNGCITMVNSF